jgi:hypothetical protein
MALEPSLAAKGYTSMPRPSGKSASCDGDHEGERLNACVA